MREDAALVAADRRRQTGDEGWVESIVQVAQTCNKLFNAQTCRLCHVYADKQLEFECEENTETATYSPVERAWLKTGREQNSLEVDLYRQFLFDEDSVVKTATSRDEDDGSRKNSKSRQGYRRTNASHEEDHSVVTQRTS